MSVNVKAQSQAYTLAESSEILKCHVQTAAWTATPGTRNITEWSMTLPTDGEVVGIVMSVAGGYCSTVQCAIRSWTQSGKVVTPSIVIESARSANADVTFRFVVLYK